MTSVVIPPHQFAQTEIFETYYEDMSNPDDVDDEMTDYDKQELLENGLDENDLYNADNQSIIVEPPQSDAVMTHAPSTIVDEMEYLDDSDYQVDDAKPVNITLQESTAEEVYSTGCFNIKPEVTTIHTPPAESSTQLHPHFSPAPRMLISQRPQTPLITTLTATTVDDPVDDEWPICLETPTGQEYILFRSDGDTEALFEDSWLKSQSLETFFSSLRQTLSDELASLTSSFAMEEIVLAIPDLEVSIAEVWPVGLRLYEDNCYTKEISLQDLVNLINSLHVKSGAERPETCRLLLSLQPRFIARFNQLVSLSSQSWNSTVTKQIFEAEGHPEDQPNPDDEQNPGDEQNPDNEGNSGEDPNLLKEKTLKRRLWSMRNTRAMRMSRKFQNTRRMIRRGVMSSIPMTTQMFRKRMLTWLKWSRTKMTLPPKKTNCTRKTTSRMIPI
jgi:hypothetical protein